MSTPPLGHRFAELVTVMARLLAPDGCPWDREQTLASLRPFLVEETYEVLDALDHDDVAGHREELGDVLMQIVFHAAIRQAEGAFDVDDVSAGIIDKLVRRHPHVFLQGDVPGLSHSDKPEEFTPPRVARATSEITSAEVLIRWEQIKAAEKAGTSLDGKPARTLAGVPRGLPALARAQKLGHKAGKVGFDWGGWQGSLAKVREEVDEVIETAESGDNAAAHHEIGDLLFAVVNLARKLEVDAETALTDASARFTKRFEYIEDRLGEQQRRPQDSDLAEMDQLWNQAKVALAGKSA